MAVGGPECRNAGNWMTGEYMIHPSIQSCPPSDVSARGERTEGIGVIFREKDIPVLKVSDNPPILTPDVDSLADLSGQWWVAHTKARNEKALAWDLLHRGVGYFLPMRERVFFSGGRRRRGLMPLFTSYVFLCGDGEDRLAALKTNRVCQTLDVADQACLIDELTAIEKALLGRATLEPFTGIAIGQRCRVVAGPFRDIEGVVVERGSRARLVLNVGLLGQGAAMEIEADLLESLD